MLREQNTKPTIILKTIAAILLITFLAQDIVWPFPDISSNNKLAVTGLQNPETVDRLKTVMESARGQSKKRPEKSTLDSAESVYKDYFETIFEFNIRLFVLLAQRVKARKSADQAASDKIRADIEKCTSQITWEITKFEQRLKEVRVDAQVIESHLLAKVQFIKANDLIGQNNEPAANAALVGALNMISLAREKILKKRIVSSRHSVRVTEEDHKIVMWQQVYTRKDKESKTLVPVYAKRTFDLSWLAGSSLDRQEESNLDEHDKMADHVRRIEKDQITAETNPSALTTANVDQILSGLSGVQVEEKRLARIVLEAVKELVEMGETGSVKYLLPVAKRYLYLRVEDINSILYYIQTARAAPLRALIAKRNRGLMLRVANIKDMITRFKYEEALGSAYGLLKTVKPYLAEPDLDGFDDMLWSVINELNALKKASGESRESRVIKFRARLWLEKISNKLEESQFLNEFMEAFGKEYVRRRLEMSPVSSREDTFIDVFEKFVKQKNLVHGEPRTHAFQILCYMAVFISLEMDNPAKPSERIPNPVFKAMNALRLIVEVDHIKTITDIKRLKALKSTINMLNGLKANSIHGLAFEERKQLVRAIAKDIGLTDQQTFELARAFAINRENLHKTYESVKDRQAPLPNAEQLARQIEKAVNERSAVKGKDGREYILRPAMGETNDGWAMEIFIYPIEAVLDTEFIGSIRLTVLDAATIMIHNADIRDKADQGQGIFTHILDIISEASDDRVGLVLYKVEQIDTLIEATELLPARYLNPAVELILEKAKVKGIEAVKDYYRLLHDNLAAAMSKGAQIDANALASTPLIRVLNKAGYDAKFVVEKAGKWSDTKYVVNIRAVKSKKTGPDLVASAQSLGQAIINAILPVKDIASETISGKALILYADDILERGAAGDLAYTLSNSQVLDNSTIVIYGRNPIRAKLLEKIISEATGDKNITIVKVELEDLRGYNGFDQINSIYPNEAKELELLLSRLAAHHKISNGNILGAIKGMTNDASMQAIKELSLEKRLPVVSFEEDKGIYSFRNALAELIAISKDDKPPANREWYRTLKPIEKEDIERAYQDYRRALEIAINA